MYFTQADIANIKISSSAPVSQSDIIRELISEHKDSQAVSDMKDGESYYDVNNTEINKKKFDEYVDENNVTQKQADKATSKIAHGFYRKQVIEKAAYLLKNEMTVSYDSGEDAATEETRAIINSRNSEIVSRYKKTLGREFQDTLVQWVEGASNKGYEWLHFFFDGEKFDYMVTSAINIIPIYETSKQAKLTDVIRYYQIEVDEAGNKKKRFLVEWWTADGWTKFSENSTGEFKIDDGFPSSHFELINTATGKRTEGNWGEVPFVVLQNNNSGKADITFVKDLVDAYDLQVSLLANDLEDIQEAILKAVGTGEKPSAIRANVKKFKCVSLPEGGDLDKIVTEIPYQAKEMLLGKLQKNIVASGMGLDFDVDRFGASPTGVALKWMYLPLELKVGMLERKLIAALYKVFWFVNKYYELTNQSALSDEDLENFTFNLNKFILANEAEKIESFSKVKGLVSDKTALKNMPWVVDVEDEITLIQEDIAKQQRIEIPDIVDGVAP